MQEYKIAREEPSKKKDGNDKPFYDYEQIIFDSLVTHDGNKHPWIKKATGLGFSNFMLRFMA